ncbi:MAG: PqiC family protein [candidate division WOR-3 bacterium]
MKRTAFIRTALLVVFAAPLVLVGCGTSPASKFYVLNAVKGQDVSGQVTSGPHALALAVGPVSIPDYLDRPQIVTHTAQHQLTVNEFQRWGGSLSEDIERVVIENLSGLLASDRVLVVSWQRRITGGHRVNIEINRFDAVPGGSVLLKATWALQSHDTSRVFVTQTFMSNQALSGTDYATLVAGMSEALGALSQEIAASVKSIIAAKVIQPPTGTTPESRTKR